MKLPMIPNIKPKTVIIALIGTAAVIIGPKSDTVRKLVVKLVVLLVLTRFDIVLKFIRI